MKHRPTEIPYIPKDRRRLSFLPDDGGPKTSRTARRALQGTDHGARQQGCARGLSLLIVAAIVLIGIGMALAIFDEADDRAVPTDAPHIVTSDTPVGASSPASVFLPDGDGPRTPPQADLRGLFSAEDYPASALQRGEEGTVGARLSIDAQGRVTGCDIIASSGSAALDSVTCTRLADGRFTPARDLNDNPIASIYEAPAIRWEIPD